MIHLAIFIIPPDARNSQVCRNRRVKNYLSLTFQFCRCPQTVLSPLSANPQRATFLKTGLMGDLFFREELDVTLETDIDFRLLSSSQKATQRLLSLSGSAGFLCPAGGLWEGRHFVTSSNIGLCRVGLLLSVRGWSCL